LYIDVHHL